MSNTFYKSEYTNRLFQYIENNISDDLDTGLLSSIGYISRDKLYSDFYSLCGHSVKEYIRKRRLSNALALIKASDLKLTDIAFQCGYSSHQALCRTVGQTLELTPSEYKNGNTYYFFPPFNGEPLQSVTVSNDNIPRVLRVLFYHSSLSGIENMAVGTFLQAFPDYNGRIFGRNGKQEGGRFCYELYLTDTNIKYDILSAYGFETAQEIPCFTATFATSAVINNESKIDAAWDYLYSEWLQNSMFEYTGEPYYEEYILRKGKPVKLKLYLPIRERGEETKITLISKPGLRFITAKAKGHNAEEAASQMAVNYLTAHYPHIINSFKEIYLHKDANYYVCGVRTDYEIKNAADDENIIAITANKNNYLVLESNVTGDYDRYAELLLSFARDNGMVADKNELFAVYDTKVSFDNMKIKMYCPVKIRTK